jgi:hypothetical protein
MAIMLIDENNELNVAPKKNQEVNLIMENLG